MVLVIERVEDMLIAGWWSWTLEGGWQWNKPTDEDFLSDNMPPRPAG
jgi:hypothetical protein